MMEVKKLDEKVVAVFIEYESIGASTLQLLELVDDIERLGLGYRFQANITRALNKVASINETEEEDDDDDNLHAVSLKFRLLREHGYTVSQDFLGRFKDSHGGFMECLQTNIKALLSIYEASYLALESELDLHKAKLFATGNFQRLSGRVYNINHPLDIPLYRGMNRLQARWYIDAYGKRKDANRLLLELAILDFNMVQSANKRDLQQVSKWWKDTRLTNNLRFTTDRLMECFFFSVGMVFEPRYDSCRISLTKVCVLITTLHDIYHIYESLDELKAFTNAVKRWDINAVENMHKPLQVGMMALYNTINQISYDTLVTQRKDIIPTLAKVWGELCEALFVEAKWTQTNYMPTLDEYLDNAWRSVSGVVILTHGYLSMNQYIRTDAIDPFETSHDLFKWSSMIFRLNKDLLNSSDEIGGGQSANAISCYMHENGVSEEVARKYVNSLIDIAWMKIIEARIACSEDLADSFIDMAINLARVSYNGDGRGPLDAHARVLSVIIEPITIV